MRARTLFAAFLLCTSFNSIALAQHAPLCDVTCGPDPSSSTYTGTFKARPARRTAATVPSPRFPGGRRYSRKEVPLKLR